MGGRYPGRFPPPLRVAAVVQAVVQAVVLTLLTVVVVERAGLLALPPALWLIGLSLASR